jgi:uncharacterized protein (TIGR02217 family)
MTLPTRWQVPITYSATNDPDVFPALPGQTFIVNKSPKFPATIIKTAASGRETRLQVASQPTWDFKVSYEYLTNNSPTSSDLQSLYAFFLTRNGQAQPFFFLDPYDNTVSNQYIGTGNGAATAFQLVRTIAPANYNAFVENVFAVLGSLTVLVNGTTLYGPAQQNLLSYSNAVGGTGWFFGNTTQGAAITAPDGTASGYLIQDTTATAQHEVAGAATLVANGTYTFSVYLKAGAYNTAQILIANNAYTSAAGVVVTLSGNGSVSSPYASGTAAVLGYTITNAGNGWYRCTITATIGAYTAANANINLNGGNAYAGTVGNGIYCWGAQLEAGAAATTLNATNALAGDFTIGANGLITFNTAPANTAPIYWSGQFLFLCRFAQDNLDAEQMTLNLWSNKGLEFASFHP